MSHRISGLRMLGLVACLALAACGQLGSGANQSKAKPVNITGEEPLPEGTSLSVLLKAQDNPNVTVAVNKYIWNATLEVLNFLPVQSADPFSGLIVTGYGTPPGGRTAYRATILINDPALDARSLNLSLRTRSGPVDTKTRTAVEDAILTRARQLRVADLQK